MFTGLVEEQGALLRIKPNAGGLTLEVSCSTAFAQGVNLGDSVSVDGCCLTAVSVARTSVAFDAVEETVSRSIISRRSVGEKVNLERSLRVGDRIGGHFVSGHIDGVGKVISASDDGLQHTLSIALQNEMLVLCIEKGSIAVNGVSLTIAKLTKQGVEIAVIPHTWSNTNLCTLRAGSHVNIETDMLGKFVKRILSSGMEQGAKKGSKVDGDFLREHGFM